MMRVTSGAKTTDLISFGPIQYFEYIGPLARSLVHRIADITLRARARSHRPLLPQFYLAGVVSCLSLVIVDRHFIHPSGITRLSVVTPNRGNHQPLARSLARSLARLFIARYS